MRRLLPLLPAALLLLVACGEEAAKPASKEDLARLALEALKADDVERFASGFPTEADLTWMLETTTREDPVETRAALQAIMAKNGGPEGIAREGAKRIRESFANAREAGAEIWDWSAATFVGLVEEKSGSVVEEGLEGADIYFMVRAGDREELFVLRKCARMQDRWITMLGLTFRASPHPSLGEAKIRLTKHRLRMLGDMVKLFEMKNGRLPESIEDLGNPGGGEGERVAGTEVTDAWGNAFTLRIVGDTVLLRSPGPDGVMETEDDVSWPEAE